MPAPLYRLPAPESAAPLRLTLAAGAGPHVEAVVRAYFPPPHDLAVGRGGNTPGGAVDVHLAWWPGPMDRPAGRPLVALCTGGADVLAAALAAGADYALTLPVSPALLRAVCVAFDRMRAGAAPPPPAPPALPFDLDGRARTLAVAGRPVQLTLREFDLLAYFAAHAGACCTRDELLEHVWGIDFETGTNTVDVFVYALRRKLEAAGLPGIIQTVRGAGYRLDP